MRRPFVWMAVPVCLYSAFGAVFRINFFILLIISLIIFSMIISKTKTEYKKHFFIFLSIFCVFSIICIGINSRENTLVKEVGTGGTQAIVTGSVKKVNVYDERMYVQLSSVDVQAGNERSHLKGVLLKAPLAEVGIGDEVTAKGKLSEFEKARNEGNFDPESYYRSIGIEAVADTKQQVSVRKTGNLFFRAADTVRRHFKESFEICTPGHKGELSSIIIGDKSDLDEEVKDLYSENGIAHILAISGLHISFAGLGLYKILRKTGLSVGACTVLAGVCVIGYVVLTGSSISAWRACIMFLFAAAADVFGRSYDALTALSIQAIVTLLITPGAIQGASFIMSYTAVLSIIISNEAFGNVLYRLKGNLTILRVLFSDIISSVFIFLLMFPVNLYFYHSVPVYSVFLNMLILPLSTILMPLGIAAGIFGKICPPVGVFFAGGAERILDFYTFACNTFSNLPFNHITPGTPGVVACIMFFSAFVWWFVLWKFHFEEGLKERISDPAGRVQDVFAFFKSRVRLMAISAVPFFVTFAVMLKPKKDCFYISMIDVGQGDCILVHTESGKNLLFDGGSTDVKNVYKNRIKPFLESRGICRIDVLSVSHTDADHVNGLTELLKESDERDKNRGNIKVGALLLPCIDDTLKDEFYIELQKLAMEKRIETGYAKEGVSISGEGFAMECLSPDENSYSKDKNELSAVFKLTTDNISILFTGDMTEESERLLLNKGEDVNADILKTAHHGSNYSSCEEFIEAVSPGLCIISCGVSNRYGHPGSETMERFDERGIPTVVTSERGQIFIEKTGNGIKVRTMLIQ